MQIRPEKFQQQLLGSRALASILCYLFIFVFFWRWGRAVLIKAASQCLCEQGLQEDLSHRSCDTLHTHGTHFGAFPALLGVLSRCVTSQINNDYFLSNSTFQKKKRKVYCAGTFKSKDVVWEFYVNSHNHKLPLSFIYSPTCWRKLGWSFVVRQTFLEQK